ncbi:lymphocyte antigen 75-like [Xyrauchen texanus]|uniref:lymphocyte antigen 75-like n=1 Tax=Xyrauchen texanus TaxID=154827 RepID=UPI002241E091|nr:lymphocyte antigen 75-like [Xyrauchen texanus]
MECVLVLFLLSGHFWSSSGLSRQYHYINERKNWNDAQSYCRSRYTDLATVDNMNDVSRLVKTVDAGYSGSVWIGLKRGTQSRWGWSMGDNTLTQYSGWKPGNPDGEGECVYFAYGFWFNRPCSKRLYFVCYNESTGYNMVNVWKNWTEAQSYCRQYHTDLPTIHSSEQQNQIYSIVGDGPWVWIGLFLDSWEWSDQWSLFFRYWAAEQPSQGSDCVGMSTADSGRWVPDSCDLQRPFICHGVSNDEKYVFVLTGGSVTLNIQIENLPPFETLVWMNNTLERFVTFKSKSKTSETMTLSSYKDRVIFNQTSFSLTLKNMQKTDSEVYRALIFGHINTNVAEYKVSVIDAVEAPVLNIFSDWSSDSCTVKATCRSHDLSLSTSYKISTCCQEDVTSFGISTLILHFTEDSVICNHSNPVSWRLERKEIKQLCPRHESAAVSPSAGVSLCLLKTVLFSVSLVLMMSAVITVHIREKLRKKET